MQKHFPLSIFVFIDSLVVSALQTEGGYAISRQNNLELHLGCHNCWLSYFTLVWLLLLHWTYGHVIAKISRTGRLPHFLTHGASLRALLARELRFKFCIQLLSLQKITAFHDWKRPLIAICWTNRASSFINCMSTPCGTLFFAKGRFLYYILLALIFAMIWTWFFLFFFSTFCEFKMCIN